MDQHVEDAFRLNVKMSLLEISKAINGDGKSTPNPLFRVKVVLPDKNSKAKMATTPTVNRNTNLIYMLLYIS